MNVKIDRMRFQLNHLSYWLGILGFLIYIVYISVTLDNIPKTMTLGLEVMLNLFFFMILFLGLERTRQYDKKWSLYVILLGIITLLRILWHPMVLNSLKTDNRVLIGGVSRTAFISGASLAITGTLIIISGVIGYRKSCLLFKYLAETGLDLNDFSYNPDGTKKERK